MFAAEDLLVQVKVKIFMSHIVAFLLLIFVRNLHSDKVNYEDKCPTIVAIEIL